MDDGVPEFLRNSLAQLDIEPHPLVPTLMPKFRGWPLLSHLSFLRLYLPAFILLTISCPSHQYGQQKCFVFKQRKVCWWMAGEVIQISEY